MTKPEIHLAISFDQNYIKQFYALLYSILGNNAHLTVHFHCIVTGLDEEAKKQIDDKITEHDCVLNYYQIDEKYFEQFKTGGSWSKATYYRLFFPFLISESVTKLLYIDTDILVVGDLAEFLKQEHEGYPICAVYDNYVMEQPLIGVTGKEKYFNAGVLWIDTDKWRKQRITEQCIDYLLTYPERIKYVDQCALNAILKDNWKRIPEKFNMLTSYIPVGIRNRDKKSFLDNVIIIHFTLQRPWKYLNIHPFRRVYNKYLSKSGAGKPIDDYTIGKLPSRVKASAVEWYMKNDVVKEVWRKFKRIGK